MSVRSGVVTPEAVLLELPTAGVATRAFARLVDLVAQIALALALALLSALVLPPSVNPLLVALAISFTVLIVAPVATEVLWRGRSPGKALFGLRVVGADGAPEAPRQAVVRGLVALVDLYLSVGFVALAASMFTPATQRAGDLAAGTVVIRVRAVGSSAPPIAFHPPVGYEAYVASLDVSLLDDEDFSLVRETLLRVASIDPQRRNEVLTDLANAVRDRIRHTLPGPIDAQTWLVCVASAYQLRRGGLLSDAAAGLAPLAPVVGPVVPGR